MADHMEPNGGIRRPWWIRLCRTRWWWRLLGILWTTIVLGLAVSVGATWLITKSQQWNLSGTHLYEYWVPIALIIGTLILLTLLSGGVNILNRQQGDLLPPRHELQRRIRVLQYLHQDYSEELKGNYLGGLESR